MKNEKLKHEIKQLLTGVAYYDKKGKEITLMEWGEKFEHMEYKIVKQTHLNDLFVSTVWIGLDHSLDNSKQIFETMIFRGRQSQFDYHVRYSTEEEALEGHDRALNFCVLKMLKYKSFKSLEGGSETDSQQEGLVPLP